LEAQPAQLTSAVSFISVSFLRSSIGAMVRNSRGEGKRQLPPAGFTPPPVAKTAAVQNMNSHWPAASLKKRPFRPMKTIENGTRQRRDYSRAVV
jgi:hypothetical protein